VNAAQSEAIQSCVSSGFPDQGSQSEIAAALKLGLKKAEPLAYSIRLPDPGQNKDPLLNLPCEALRVIHQMVKTASTRRKSGGRIRKSKAGQSDDFGEFSATFMLVCA
jgi:hypothetical protein